MSVDVVTVVQQPTPVVTVTQQPVKVVSVVQVGPQGPTGPPGGATAPYMQSTPLGSWAVPNPFTLPYIPAVTVLDTTGRVVLADIQISPTFVTITFASPTAGTAVLS